MRWWLLLLFAALPLQWVLVPLPGMGPEPLHVLAMLLLGGLVSLRFRRRAADPVLTVAASFVAVMLGLQALSVAAALYHSLPVMPAVNQLLFLGSFVAVAVLATTVWSRPSGRAVALLRWAALVCGVSLVAGLTYSMARNGVNPAQVMARTVATGDPHILEREMFRNGVAGFGYDSSELQSNIRHEIFGAVLVALCVSSAAARLHPFRGTVARSLFRGSQVLSVALILVSLSRSVMLALLSWAAISFLRAFRLGRLTNAQLSGVALSGVGVAVLVLTGFWSVLVARFATDTTSYAARDTLLQDALADIASHLWIGGVDTAGRSSHNLVLDSWLRTGVVGAVLAALAALLVLRLWLGLVARIHREPPWMVPIAVLLTFPVVRMFTAGGGAITPVAWVALALGVGALAADIRRPVPGHPDPRRTEIMAVDARPLGRPRDAPY